MIVLIAVVPVAISIVTLARAISGKLVGIGSVNSLDDIHHITVIT